jgi:hypothetical protein
LQLDPSFAGSNSAEGDGLLRAIRIRSSTSFGEEIKPEAPCRKSLACKNHLQYEKNTSEGQIYHFLRPLPCLLPDDSADMIARELWWTNQKFYTVDIIPLYLSMLIYYLGANNSPIGGRSAEK